MEKSEVRAVAREADFAVADKKDSQELCFIPDGDIGNFLLHYAKKMKKNWTITNVAGHLLGEYQGLAFFTIGQKARFDSQIMGNWRKSQISNLKSQIKNYKSKIRNSNLQSAICNLQCSSPRLYVVKLDGKNNRVIIGEDKDLFVKKLVATEANILDTGLLNMQGKKVLAQIRSGQEPQLATIKRIATDSSRVNPPMSQSGQARGSALELMFEKPVRAVTPGQSVVLYDKSGKMLGGGVIS